MVRGFGRLAGWGILFSDSKAYATYGVVLYASDVVIAPAATIVFDLCDLRCSSCSNVSTLLEDLFQARRFFSLLIGPLPTLSIHGKLGWDRIICPMD